MVTEKRLMEPLAGAELIMVIFYVSPPQKQRVFHRGALAPTQLKDRLLHENIVYWLTSLSVAGAVSQITD